MHWAPLSVAQLQETQSIYLQDQHKLERLGALAKRQGSCLMTRDCAASAGNKLL